MAPEQLAEIEARLKAATPGPWIPHFRYKPGHPWEGCDIEAGDERWAAKVHTGRDADSYARDAANARFIAHAPTDIAALLAEVRRLTPTPKVAVWEAGVDDYEGCTVLRDPASGAVLGWYNSHNWGGSIWRYDAFTNRKSLTDLAVKKGWEVRDA